MGDVKRYAFQIHRRPYGLEEVGSGNLVMHSDYAKLEAEAQALREQNTKFQHMLADVVTKHFTENIKRSAAQKSMDVYLSEGIRLLEEELEALRARVVVPDGYVLVPVEPTRDMFIAVNKEDDKAYAGGCDHGAQFDWLWDAALEAAPSLNGKAVSEGLLRSACSSITRLILSAQTRPSCQKGMVDPCRCHRCNVDRALKVDAELRALIGEGKEHD